MTSMTKTYTLQQKAVALIKAQFMTKRFTIRELVEHLAHDCNRDPGQYEVCYSMDYEDGEPCFVKISNYHTFYDAAIRALKMEENGERLFYHSIEPADGPTWFHRELSTPEEEIAFGEYRLASGKAAMKEGRRIRRRGLKRQRELRDMELLDLVMTA